VLIQRLMAPGGAAALLHALRLCRYVVPAPDLGPRNVRRASLNGSVGGINEPRGRLYASRGYAAPSLSGYFKTPPGLSDYNLQHAGSNLPPGTRLIARELSTGVWFVSA